MQGHVPHGRHDGTAGRSCARARASLMWGHEQANFDIIVIGAGIAGASVRPISPKPTASPSARWRTGRAITPPGVRPPPMSPITARRRCWPSPVPRRPILGGRLPHRATRLLRAAGAGKAVPADDGLQKGMRRFRWRRQKAHSPARRRLCQRAVLDATRPTSTSILLHQPYLKLFRQRGGELPATTGARRWKERPWTVRRGRNAPDTDHRRCGGRLGRCGGGDGWEEPSACSPSAAPWRWCRSRGRGLHDWPLVGDVGETWYCKPQSGKLLDLARRCHAGRPA